MNISNTSVTIPILIVLFFTYTAGMANMLGAVLTLVAALLPVASGLSSDHSRHVVTSNASALMIAASNSMANAKWQ